MNQLHDYHLYGKKYFDGFYLHDAKRDKQYKQERARLMQFAPLGGRILDIGCGVGGFLAGLDDRWDKHGFEISEHAARIAQGRGIKMVAPGLSDEPFPTLNRYTTESFDVVIMRGVLQHINTPMQDLAHVARILKPGGLLVVLATPNTESIVYRLWGHLPPLDPHRNWILWGRAQLDNVLERLGFDKRTWYFPYKGTPYAQPLKDFIKFGLCLLFGYRWKFAFPGNMMEVFSRKAAKCL